jgi:hypothetical protein
MVALPESRPEDDEDVVWGLSTASALWARGERRDAIVWLRRAADAAVAAGQEFRGSELGMYASELEDTLNAAGAHAEAAAQEVPPAAPSGTGLASPETIELLDIDADRPSQVSIDLEDETLPFVPVPPAPPPGRIALTPAPVAPPRSAFPPPVAPLPIPTPPPKPASSAPKPITGAPPLAASTPAVVIPPPAPLGIAAPQPAVQMPHSFEMTPMPASSSLRAAPSSSRRMSPTPARKSQPRGPILDPWADEPTDPGISTPRPTVSFRQIDGGGGDELVLPRRAQVMRSFDSDDEVVTSAAPLDASLTRKVEPRPPRKPVKTAPSAAAPAPGQLAQAAAIVPTKSLSIPPPPASAPPPKATPPAPPPPTRAAAPPPPPIEAPPPAPIAPAPIAAAPPAPAPPPLAAIKPAPPAIAASPAVAAKPSIPPPPTTPWPAPAVARPSVAPPPVVAAPAKPPPAPAVAAPVAPAETVAAPTVAAPIVAAPTIAAATAPAAPPPAARKLSVPPAPLSTPPPRLSFPPPPALPSVPKPSVAPAAPPAKSLPPPPAVLLDGLPLDEVDAFVDLPPEMQQRLVALARIEALSADEEVSSFGAALLLAGEASVCATIVDTPACRAVKGTLVPSRGSLAEPVGIRVVAGSQGARVAIWEQPIIEDALKSCPWVLDELVSRADRIQALAGATMGPLGEVDEASRNELLDRLIVHFAQPFESLVDDSGATLGIAVVGGGVVDLVAHGDLAAKALHPGETLFARAVLEGRPAPRGAQAGASGALVLVGEAKIAKELMASSPPLAAILGDATD